MNADFEGWAREQTPVLLGAARLLTGHRQQAEDLVQEVLQRVAGSWGRVEHPDAYARQVMYRLELRRWRRRRISEILTPIPPTGAAAADLTGQVDLRLVLDQALRALPRRQRAVIVLRYFEDRTESDIAAVLGCSVGTVKSQSFKALRAIRNGAPELNELVVRSSDELRT